MTGIKQSHLAVPEAELNRPIGQKHPNAESHAFKLIYDVCCMAGSTTLLGDGEIKTSRHLRKAIERHDTPRLFRWFVEKISFQGISDRVAASYIRKNGLVEWQDIVDRLSKELSCAKLHNYWSFYNCGYDKTRRNCSQPALLEHCPVTRHELRNGRLNQSAYSLYLFFRDVADNDIVSWFDRQIQCSGAASDTINAGELCESVVGPLRGVFGVSDKILAMALSELFLAAPPNKKFWKEIGCNLIAIDSLVHNFLHRTGILTLSEREHAYGPGCYQSNGCVSLIRHISSLIDARRFNRNYPQNFPRFVQHAIWRFCAADGLNVCNGNQIDDKVGCQNGHCRLYGLCQRQVLRLKKQQNQ